MPRLLFWVDSIDRIIFVNIQVCHVIYRPKKNAIFLMDLTFEEDTVTFSTKPQKFGDSVITLFNKGVNCTKKIPQLEKMVMENLFWSGSPLLESVGENEPLVVQLRETVQSCLQKAMIPLLAYAKEYEKFLWLANMDINEYLM